MSRRRLFWPALVVMTLALATAPMPASEPPAPDIRPSIGDVSRSQPTPTAVPATPAGGRDPSPTPTPMPTPAPLVEGIASWYDAGPGLYAARPGWRWGDPPYDVRVCRADDDARCVVVRVWDCLCGRTDRLIDLSPDAFGRLEELRRGLVRVTLEEL